VKVHNDYLTSAHMLLEKGRQQSTRCRFMISSDNEQWNQITWGEFLKNTVTYAHVFSYLGIGVDKKAAIFARTRVEWAYAGIGLQFCRGVLVPLYSSLTPEQIKYIINHSDSEIVITEAERLSTIFTIWNEIPQVNKIILFDIITESELAALLKEYNIDNNQKMSLSDVKSKILTRDVFYRIGKSLHENEPDRTDKFVNEIQKGDTSAIVYTSGTTGDPKGVVLTYENLYRNSKDWLTVLGPYMPDKRVDLLWLPTSHIFGWGELGLGNVLDFVTYFTNPLDVLNLMPKVKPTVFMSVPAYWEKLYIQAKSWSDVESTQLERLHYLTGGELDFCLSGGAGLKREVKEFYHKAGLFIIEGYGLTECSPTLTMNRKEDYDFDSVGKPFPSVKLKIASDGEILAKGPNVFKGYYKASDATKESFDSEGWFKTGDIGKLTERGFLKILGRKKEIIVTSGGKNISPQLIESRFNDDPFIEHLVLYGNEKKYLTALVTLRENAVVKYAQEHNLSFENFPELTRNPAIISLIQKRIDKINKNLASFETIKKFYIYSGHLTVEDGHLTASLKLKRNKVYETFRDNLDALYENQTMTF
jgi:long-chain acyl-CoA synthetase